MSWRCSACARINRASNNFCAGCGGQTGTPVTQGKPRSQSRRQNRPKSPRRRSGQWDRWESDGHGYAAGWAAHTYQHRQPPPPPWAGGHHEPIEVPAKGAKGGGKGKPAQLPAFPPAWPSSSLPSSGTGTKDHLQVLLQEVRKLPEAQISDSLRKALREADDRSAQGLQMRASELGAAKRHMESVQESQSARLNAWEKYLDEAISSWESHLTQFNNEQDEFAVILEKAEARVLAAKKAVQEASADIAALGVSEQTTATLADMDIELIPDGDAQAPPTLAMSAFRSRASTAQRRMADLITKIKDKADDHKPREDRESVHGLAV